MRTWKNLLREAAKKEGLKVVGWAIGYSKSTLSMVLSGTYDSDVETIRRKVIEVYGDEADKVPEGYRKNASGHLIPKESIKEIDITRDELVTEIIYKASQVVDQVKAFKEQTLDDIQAFVELSGEKYGAKMGGQKGNVTLSGFDGKYRIVRAVSDKLEFDERLQAAKSLIDECLKEWTKDSRSELRAIIDQAFQVDRTGRVNAKRIMALRQLNIQDEKWLAAMEALADSLQVTGSRTYIRIYERQPNGEYKQLALDVAAA